VLVRGQRLRSTGFVSMLMKRNSCTCRRLRSGHVFKYSLKQQEKRSVTDVTCEHEVMDALFSMLRLLVERPSLYPNDEQ
jgi:hypothetical protein